MGDRMHIGCAWYPEQIPRGQWGEDLDLMLAADLNVVRVGEFAWSRLEPAEDRFDFDWMDEAVALAGQRGLAAIMSTPTAAPPIWLTQRYPAVLRVLPDGRRMEHDTRQHFNPASVTYLERYARLAEAMARRYGGHPAVIGWQIDNEMGDISYDADTRRQFQDYCREEFGTIASLNERWGNTCWSQEYTDWRQIPLGVKPQNACLMATFGRFITRVWKNYFDNQADAIRRHIRRPQFETHNFSYTFSKQDPHELTRTMDFGGVDAYPFRGHLDATKMGFFLAATRGLKRGPFWVMETQPGFVNYMPVNVCLDPGETRRMVWHQVGHGADGVMFWQWRSSRGGLEQWHGTLVGTDGRPRPVYDDVARAGRELKSVGAVLAGTAVRPRVALAWSYRDRAAIETCPFHKGYDPWHYWRDQYGALRRLGLDVEVLRADQGLAGYDLVFSPQMIMLDAALEELLVAYVQGGGHLVLGPRSGFVNSDGALLPARAPGATLAALAGGHSVEHYSLPSAIPVGGRMQGQALIWAEWLEADAPDTDTILRYGPGHAWLQGKAALLTRRVGQGWVSLLGAWLDDAGMVNVAEWACRQQDVPLPWGRLPEGIEVSCRQATDRRIHVICNHGAQDCSLRLPFRAADALTHKPLGGDITVPGNNVLVALEQIG